MNSHAQIPRELVYLGCHMQGQGLLTDMISLVHGKEHIIPRQSDPTSILSKHPYLSDAWNC